MRNILADLHSDVRFGDINIKINEQRAPTDESIKILNEMQDKALKNIIGHIKVEDNTLNGVALAYIDGFNTMARDQVTIFLKFSVNGKEYFFEEEAKRFSFLSSEFNSPEVIEALGDKLKARIAEVVFTQVKIVVLEQLTGKNLSHLKK